MLPPGAAVLVFQPGPHGLVKRLAIYAFKRTAQHPATIEEGEGQIPLLHAARIALRVHLSQQFEELGNRLHGRSTNGCQRLSRLDAQPEILFRQCFPQCFNGRRSPPVQCDQGLAGTVTGIQRGRLQHFHQGWNGDLLRRPSAIAARSRTTGDQLPRRSKSCSALSLS